MISEISEIILLLFHLFHLFFIIFHYFSLFHGQKSTKMNYKISYYFSLFCIMTLLYALYADKFARLLFEFHAHRFESLNLPFLPADRNDFDVHGALLDDKVHEYVIL